MDTHRLQAEIIEDKAISPPPPPPSSSVTSPSHEFSFTISFQPPLTVTSAAASLKSGNNKCCSAPAVDLAPADDIFLHGHLLPLHLLSHPASPPRPSDITLENLALPVGHVDSERHFNYDPDAAAKYELNDRPANTKAGKTFASFFGLARPRKRGDGAGEKQEEEGKRKRRGFDVARLLKKYASLMEAPLLFFRGDREKRGGGDIRRRPYSFNGHSNRSEQAEGLRRRKGQFSAPASTRTSPTNSGLLSPSAVTFNSSDNSTMEELQSAIQAAIAHCKNSIAAKQRGET